MRVLHGLGLCVLALLSWQFARSQNPLSLDAQGLADAAKGLREAILVALSAKLHESSSNWGQTRPVRTLRWRGRGLNVYAQVVDVPRNDGVWRKIVITARDPARSLQLHLSNLQFTADHRMLVDVYLALDVNVEMEQQIWESGVRLYSGSTRARLRGQLRGTCEIMVRPVASGAWLPDLMLRLRFVRSEVSYDNLVVEHVAGVGGTTARLAGETLRGAIKQFYPSLERDLLARANAAVLAAGDSREVRLAVGSLLKLKKQ